MSINLTKDQTFAHDTIVEWVKDQPHQLFTMGGYAGTGKTTIIGKIAHTIRDYLDGNTYIAFVSFTGKASCVLRDKLIRANSVWENAYIPGHDYVGTIHSLIYEPVIVKDEKGKDKTDFYLKEGLELHKKYSLIITDEASMIHKTVMADLISFDIPILAVGDHGQLPPVKGNVSLMLDPDVKLETVHRQAENSPIIKMSMHARNDGKIPFGRYSDTVYKTNEKSVLDKIGKDDWMPMVLVGTNKLRTELNNSIRERLGFSGGVMSDEPVICLKNNRYKGIYNGEIGCIQDVRPPDKWGKQQLTVSIGDWVYRGKVWADQFGQNKFVYRKGADQFDWAYCITVHKSQGSEFDEVVLVEKYIPWMKDDERARWLYTGVTRAKEKLIVVNI